MAGAVRAESRSRSTDSSLAQPKADWMRTASSRAARLVSRSSAAQAPAQVLSMAGSGRGSPVTCCCCLAGDALHGLVGVRVRREVLEQDAAVIGADRDTGLQPEFRRAA